MPDVVFFFLFFFGIVQIKIDIHFFQILISSLLRNEGYSELMDWQDFGFPQLTSGPTTVLSNRGRSILLKLWQNEETCCQKHFPKVFPVLPHAREALFPAAKYVSSSRQKHNPVWQNW